MIPGQVPSDADIAAADHATLERYYAQCMSEGSWRHQQEHEDALGPLPDDADRPLATVSREALLRMYTAVHDEMMKRHRETPGIWGP